MNQCFNCEFCIKIIVTSFVSFFRCGFFYIEQKFVRQSLHVANFPQKISRAFLLLSQMCCNKASQKWSGWISRSMGPEIRGFAGHEKLLGLFDRNMQLATKHVTLIKALQVWFSLSFFYSFTLFPLFPVILFIEFS